MIVVVARLTTDAERRAALIEAGETVAAASRDEAGCLNYRIYEATDEENSFVIVEEWADDAALQAHFKTPHIAEFMPKVGTLVTAPPDVGFHEVASTRDLSNVAG